MVTAARRCHRNRNRQDWMRRPHRRRIFFICWLFFRSELRGNKMAVTMMSQDFATRNGFAEPSQPTNITELDRSDEAEVMEFLSARPLHTVFMMGLIRDNGLLSPRNRGSFYGSRNY